MQLGHRVRKPLDKPFELFMLSICTLYGFTMLAGGPQPQSVQAVGLHEWVIHAWSVMLLVGSVLGIIGLYWRGRLLTSIGFEATGLILTGGSTLIYAIILLVSVGIGALFAAGICLGFAAACFGRAWLLRRWAREISEA